MPIATLVEEHVEQLILDGFYGALQDGDPHPLTVTEVSRRQKTKEVYITSDQFPFIMLAMTEQDWKRSGGRLTICDTIEARIARTGMKQTFIAFPGPRRALMEFAVRVIPV